MIELRSMAVTMPEVAGHPNRKAFEGVLTRVDVPSERPPSGAKGHRVVLTRQAEAALPSLLGMAVDYSPSLDRHDVRRKVGVITRADIVGRNVELGGYLFARDFPEIVEEIAKSGREGDGRVAASCRDRRREIQLDLAGSGRWDGTGWQRYGLKESLMAAAERMVSLAARMRGEPKTAAYAGRICGCIRAETVTRTDSSGLGLSYEVTGVEVADPRKQIWELLKVTFTGAAILRRNKAAYQDTWIELA